jgi:hypothetical protein|tara:strand:+ start:1290 stop:1514 length:225 start_codon:yes stop_codon:yes gene_type:complete
MTELYKVEQGIPVPTSTTKPKGRLRMTLETLQIGESFVVPSKGERGHATTSAKAAGIKVKTASISHGYRIWRIK